MNGTTRAALAIAFGVVVVLLLLFGGGMMTRTTLSGGMMGNGAMGGIAWMWIPIVLLLGFLIVWAIVGTKK